MNSAKDTPQAVRDLVDDALREFGRGGKLNQWTEGPYNPGGLTQKVHQLARRRGVATAVPFAPSWIIASKERVVVVGLGMFSVTADGRTEWSHEDAAARR
jgi:hypothetical protein